MYSCLLFSKKDKLEQLKHQKPAERIPPPTNKVLSLMYTVAAHVSFDIAMNSLIIINMVPIILELASDDDAPYMNTLNTINYVYCTVYVTEAIWKVSEGFLLLLIYSKYLRPTRFIFRNTRAVLTYWHNCSPLF